MITKIDPVMLIIAGSDSGGGAGIQADLRVCNTLAVHGLTAIAAVTIQNPLCVKGIQAINAENVLAQIQVVSEVFSFDVVKTGMLFNAEIINVVAQETQKHQWRLVVDPVMISTSGAELLQPMAKKALIEKLLPLATIITPNLMEAEVLCQHSLSTLDASIQAAQELARRFDAIIVLKGGHREGNFIYDIVADNREQIWLLKAPRLDAKGTHGTGCTLSSAIGAFLSKGKNTIESITLGVRYVRSAILAEKRLGKEIWGLGSPSQLVDDVIQTLVEGPIK